MTYLNPCSGCKFQKGDFCKMLPWNDTRYATAWEKYQAKHGKQCDRIAKFNTEQEGGGKGRWHGSRSHRTQEYW